MTAAAYAFAADAYATRPRRPGRTFAHPIAVAALLDAYGEPPFVVVCGLLHDVLEDTAVSADELRERFGDEVARVVGALTQDEDEPRYRARKAALRERTVAAGREAATVALADKADKLAAPSKRPRRRKRDHYRATLEAVEARYGHTPLSELLRARLDAL
ncbi:MAG TPA: HD domain-containing protein [Solirubrobacter sp.]|nr:HD domain-containing protein [Solirubrobacter sp.]